MRRHWPWVSLLPLGVGAWAPIYAGSVAHRVRWMVLGMLATALVVAGWVLAIATDGGALGGGLIIAGWAGATIESFAIRGECRALLESPLRTASSEAARRLAEREHARDLARRSPQLAREMGLGRPDLPEAQAFGLIDVNNAPDTVLAQLPGVDGPLAGRIVRLREQTHGFSSLADMGAMLELDGEIVEGLRDATIFLPRPGAAA